MARSAEAIRRLVGEAFLRAGDTEHELGLRYQRATRDLMPLLSPLLEYMLNIHMRELVRRDVVGRRRASLGAVGGNGQHRSRFRRPGRIHQLGERVASEELGSVAARLAKIGWEVAQPPVRFVKTVGDAVMLVSPEASPLVEAALRLAGTVEREEDLPPLHVGVALGPAINRWGDWYGRPR